jgi:predicted RNase H-like nuclease (RuvC/YqgF family)
LDNNDYKELLAKIGDVIESISKLTTRISVIESKLEQMFDLRDDVKEMGEKQIKMEQDINAEFEKIRQLEKRNDELRKYIMGIISGLVVAVVGALIKALIGM